MGESPAAEARHNDDVHNRPAGSAGAPRSSTVEDRRLRTPARTDEASASDTPDEALASDEDVVIDLRDPSVAGGLAEALDSIVSLSERAGAAEARAEIARHERMAATGQIRRLTSDLEQEQAERHRIEVDLARTQTELELRGRELHEARAEIDRGRHQLEQAVALADQQAIELRSEVARAYRMVHMLEALVSRRRRRTYERLIQGEPLDD